MALHILLVLLLSFSTETSWGLSTPLGRPLHQAWWPLTTIHSLSYSKPNELQVLGMSLVAFRKSSHSRDDNNWVVMDDRCSHRFAPLSEGRIVERRSTHDPLNHTMCNRIQCAYHGWEFNTTGVCRRVPQDFRSVRGTNTRPVVTYPTQVRAGILWAWTDPESFDTIGSQTTIPISSALQDFVDYGQEACYMRDLPYGMELLGENLLDVSHLPFSHHGTGALRRELGGALPMKMMSMEEKKEAAKSECSVRLPRFQARILDAGQHDPIMIGFQKYSKRIPDDSWQCTAAFYEPNHIRYRRLRGGRAPAHQELFMCPLSAGRSRVFLYNARASIAPPTDTETTLVQRLRLSSQLFQPKQWKSTLRSAVISYLFDPRKVSSHMVYHDIFDGDGVFLHKQGNRMANNGLSYWNYSTPGSSDVILGAYRRYLDQAAQITKDAGYSKFARAVTGNELSYRQADHNARSRLLDRYNSHTKYCPTCQRALHHWRKGATIAESVSYGLNGACGTTALASILCAALAKAGSSFVKKWAYISAATAALVGIGSYLARKIQQKCLAMAQRFLFVD